MGTSAKADAPLTRLAAGAVAAVAWTGLAVQFVATLETTGTLPETLWVLLRYFTILANLAVALLFSAIALGRRPSPSLIAGTVLAILLVGIVAILLLRGLLDLSGGAALADTLLHKVTPILVPLWWLAFAAKGRLTLHDPWRWAIFPALYLPYALARGLAGDLYAYPFINIARLGWGQVIINAVAIAIGFVMAGYALVWLDRKIGKSDSPG